MKNRKPGILTDTEIASKWWWRRLVFADFDPETFTTSCVKDTELISKTVRLGMQTSGERNYFTELFETIHSFESEFRQWEQAMEVAALRYELVRRLRPEKRLPSWIALPMCAYAVLVPAIGQNLRKDICVISMPPRTVRGWSKPWPAFQWNLEADESQLVDHFIALINMERRQQGLPDSSLPTWSGRVKRKTHNKGNRHRKISWRWVEVLDIHRWSARTLNDSERSAKSDALREAKRWEPAFLRAWEDMMNTPMFANSPDAWKPAHHFTRWLRENFVKWYPLKPKESLPK